jgi:uncharacterized protein with beta-barrel porin domain
MNQIHRVVWNQARNCFVAASETARAKGKPSSTRKAVAAALAALCLAPGLAAAQCAGATPVAGPLATMQCYNDVDVTVANTGSITVNNAGSWAAAFVQANPYTHSFTNNGNISATGTLASWATPGIIGVGFNNDLGLGGSLNNTGTITATATVADPLANRSQGSAAGVGINGALAGGVTNSGTITATVNGGSTGAFATAYGVGINGNLSGSLTNTSTGIIAATANGASSGNDVYAYGVGVRGNLSGSLNNAGTISATAISGSSGGSPVAYGVAIGGDLSGVLNNAGTISAVARTANSSGQTPVAYGVFIGNDLTNTLINSGTISALADAQGSATATAYGVYINNNLSGALTNSGTIRAVAAAMGNGISAWATGVYVGADLTGRLSNTGSISADATAYTDDAYAYGVNVRGDLSGELNNGGNIAARAQGSTSWRATAFGVYVGALSGRLTNSGTISAMASNAGTAGSNAAAAGIFVSSDLSGSLSNSGRVSASADNMTHSAIAVGIYVRNAITAAGTLTNSGTVEAMAHAGSSGSATAVGVHVGTVDAGGTLTNTGTITASATGGTSSSGARADGVYVRTLNGTLNNSGTIRATSDIAANAASLRVDAGAGVVNNLEGGLLDGQIAVGGTVAVNNAGMINTHLNASAVAGDYNQSATGILAIGAHDTATYGQLNVGGTATLASGTGIRVYAQAGNTLAAGDVLANVVAAGTLAMPGTVRVTDNTMALNFTAANNGANGVDLTAAATGFNSIGGALGTLGGGAGAGAAGVLDNLFANADAQPGALRDMLYAIGSAGSAQQVSNLVAQTLPLLSGGTNLAIRGALQDANRLVQARLEGDLGLGSGDALLGNKYFWFKPFGSWANQNDRNGASGYDARTNGVVFGVDGELSKANRVGVALSYSQTNVDGNSAAAPNTARVNSYQAILYGSRGLEGGSELSYQADVGLHNNSGQRNILAFGTVAHADYDGWSTHVGAGFARNIKASESTTYTPSIRADYTRIHSKGYSEFGAGALNLTVGSDSVEQFILSADAKLNHKLSESTTFSANLGAGYDLINHRNSATSAFAGAPGAVFITQGIDPSAWSLRGGLGLAKMTSTGTEVSARYDLDVKEGFTNQTASVKVRVPF